jgi:hypothetical protein
MDINNLYYFFDCATIIVVVDIVFNLCLLANHRWLFLGLKGDCGAS